MPMITTLGDGCPSGCRCVQRILAEPPGKKSGCDKKTLRMCSIMETISAFCLASLQTGFVKVTSIAKKQWHLPRRSCHQPGEKADATLRHSRTGGITLRV